MSYMSSVRRQLRARPVVDRRFVTQPAIALVTVVSAALSIRWGYNPHDEGLMLQAASRIVSGQWPYRDFWTNYMPGQAGLLALLQMIFGVSLMAWRVLEALASAAIAVMAYRLARRRAPEAVSVLAALATGLVLTVLTDPEPNRVALVLGMGALLCSHKHPAWAGVAAGLCVLFRLETGAAVVIGTVVMTAPGYRLRTLYVAAAVAVVTLLPFFWVAPGSMLKDTIGFYAVQNMQRLPFPIVYPGSWLHPMDVLNFYGPMILLLTGACALVTLVIRGGASISASRDSNSGALRSSIRKTSMAQPSQSELETWGLVPLTLVGMAYLLGRSDRAHLEQLGAVAPVLAAWVAAGTRRRLVRGGLVISVALLLGYGLQARFYDYHDRRSMTAVPSEVADGVEALPSTNTTLVNVSRRLAELTRPGEPIFVGVANYGDPPGDDPLLYVLAGHPDATAYDVMQPGIVTTRTVQSQIMRSLRTEHTRVVVVYQPRVTRAQVRSYDSAPDTGVNVLGEYIAKHYAAVAKYGAFQIRLLRGASLHPSAS